jgi:hypothetical protein
MALWQGGGSLEGGEAEGAEAASMDGSDRIDL